MNTTSDAQTQTTPVAFPQAEVAAVLHTELMAIAQAEADMHGLKLPKEPNVAALAPVPMDSLVVVEILCSVQDILGFVPKDATVRPGGYNSVQDALDHLVPRLERQWHKKQGENA